MGEIIVFPTPQSKTRRPPIDPDFGERLQRIRASLEKINRLMEELKASARNNSPNSNKPS